MKTLRIFISSPGDVAEERDKAKRVIAALQREVGDEVTLLPVLWEDLAIPATASFQEGIDFVLAEKDRIDIAVFILWSRLGSPLGNAITKTDGSAYRSGTEREFDLMLAAFEQSGRKLPHILAYTRDDLGAFSDKLDARAQQDEALEELLRQRKLVKQFIQERFHDEQGRNLRAYHTYREPVGFAQRLHVHLRGAVDELLGLENAGAQWTEAPYRSLEAFDIHHAPIFCGRDEETCELLQRLRDQKAVGCAFVCIVGASGAGKSSLARAGVAATLLQRSFDEGVKEWRAATFIPGHAQGDLFNTLARSLANALPEILNGVGGLEKLAKCLGDQNHDAATILIETAIHAATNLKREARNWKLQLLLILDQMEELWTDRGITPEQRERFLQTIESLARTGSISVLATLRSDFYPQAQLSEVFLRMKGERGHFDLTPPGPAALHQLIVQPARRAGLHFERHTQTNRTLDQQILEDAARDPSALPLLQYALAELYEKSAAQPPERRSTRTLTFADYEAMGGVEGALSKRATQTFDQLSAEAQAALEEHLPLLVSVNTTGEQNAVRRRAPLADLTSTRARRTLTEALIASRLLTTDDEAGKPIATLAHEALLRRWDRLREWIDTNRNLLRMRARVEQYHAMWEESRNDTSRLLPAGLPLEEGKLLNEQFAGMATLELRQYIAQSNAMHCAKLRRRRLSAAAVVVTLAVLLILSLSAESKARENQRILEAEKARAVKAISNLQSNAKLGLGSGDTKDPVYLYVRYAVARTAAEALRELGDLQSQIVALERAKNYAEQAMKLDSVTPRFTFATACAWQLIGHAKGEQEEYANAISAYTESNFALSRIRPIEFEDRRESLRFEAWNHRQIADLHEKLNDLQSAVEHRELAYNAFGRAFSMDASSSHSEDDLDQAEIELERTRSKLNPKGAN